MDKYRFLPGNEIDMPRKHGYPEWARGLCGIIKKRGPRGLLHIAFPFIGYTRHLTMSERALARLLDSPDEPDDSDTTPEAMMIVAGAEDSENDRPRRRRRRRKVAVSA